MTKDVTESAVGWHLASASDDMDWDAFTVWLEADPAHRAAYDAVAMDDDLIAAHREKLRALVSPSEPVEQDGDGQTASKRWRWRVGASALVAAALVAVVIVPEMQAPPAQDVVYRSGGTARTISLGDGETIALAPQSMLTAHRGHATDLTLDGSAYFSVVHNPSRRLAIHAGSLRIEDVGTSFDIVTAPQSVRVQVATGQVRVTGDNISSPISLGAGHRLLATAQAVTVRTIAPGSVASWRRGQLVYQDTPITLVAADISRYAGQPVAVDPTVSERRFSGSLTIGDGHHIADTLAQVMGITAQHTDHGVRLSAHPPGD